MLLHISLQAPAIRTLSRLHLPHLTCSHHSHSEKKSQMPSLKYRYASHYVTSRNIKAHHTCFLSTRRALPIAFWWYHTLLFLRKHSLTLSLILRCISFNHQLAFFHPSFMWADTDFDEPLNYEKRAPFPTINLLRAAKIREFTSEVPSLRLLWFRFFHFFAFFLSCMSHFYGIFPSFPPLILHPLVSICLPLSTFCITYCVISSCLPLLYPSYCTPFHLVYTAFDDTSVM